MNSATIASRGSFLPFINVEHYPNLVEENCKTKSSFNYLKMNCLSIIQIGMRAHKAQNIEPMPDN
jgi:hypothetical protein